MSREGRVYWVTGLSGAGKTTVGRALYQRILAHRQNVVFLDGDILREVFGGDLGYSTEDRRKSSMRNARLCHMLASQGLDVVCCTISMFDDVRSWNREKNPRYTEIYLKVSMETLRQRNQKGLYEERADELVGLGVTMEEPKSPDFCIENDGGRTPAEIVDEILDMTGL